jgi:esterase
MTQPGWDEFSLLEDNADEAGLSWDGPPEVFRVEAAVPHGVVSGVRWGPAPSRIVFLHGGGQNAHTWDTVALALGETALALDLPGHGSSSWRTDRDYSPVANAAAVAAALDALDVRPELVVGMSLGGLTTLHLAASRPDLVVEAVAVDVTPGVMNQYPQLSAAQQGATALTRGPTTFPDLTTMIEAAVAAAPHRSRRSLERGVRHNAHQLPDGTWSWRYDRLDGATAGLDGYRALWDDVSAAPAPLTFVRGGDSHFVSEDDVAEVHRRRPDAQVLVVPGAGHAVQSDQPLRLVEILRGILDRNQ